MFQYFLFSWVTFGNSVLISFSFKLLVLKFVCLLPVGLKICQNKAVLALISLGIAYHDKELLFE